ncbi:MAG: lamin tail domain-containing protein [Cryomorphaceae bacterium]|nr:lamin tail domain-containing protein [Cryomorphaceae bacterium]
MLLTVRNLLPLALLGVWSCSTNDVDLIPQAQIQASATVMPENGGTLNLVVTLDAVSTSEVQVQLDFSGTASADDYSVSATTVLIPAGSLTASVTVTAIDDSEVEGSEFVEVRISNPVNAIADINSVASFTIDDDDQAGPSIVLNEVLYDPSNSALLGDANGDGVYVQDEDEFIELLNTGSQPLDVSGWKVYDASALSSAMPRHVFPAGSVIPSGTALVLFGGGTPSGSFGGALVQTTTTGAINLNNAGDVLTITDTQDSVMITFDVTPYSDNPNESFTRSPDITGEFVQHSTVGSGTLLFSPGTRLDGSPF